MSFTLKQFEIGPMQNFCYLIGDTRSKQALVLDPGWEAFKIEELLKSEGFDLAGVVISHAHYDHTNAILDLLKNHDVPVYAQKEEIDYAKAGLPIVGELGHTAKPVQGGELLQLGETPVQFLHTPGHTPGSQCLKVGDYLLTGDTLFIGGCGRYDLPGGDADTLFKSLKKIATMNQDLTICPGHDYGEVKQRTLADETKDNPYLREDENNLI